MDLYKKIKTCLSIIKTYRNWWSVLGDIFHINQGLYLTFLRNGMIFKVRAGEKDVNIINEVFISQSYRSALRFIKKRSTVIDIGGHIGTFAMVANKAADDVKVFTYEPFVGSYNLLKENIFLNKSRNISAFNMAVTGKGEKEIKLYIKTIGNDFAGNSVYGSGSSVSVKATNLSEIFKENEISHCDLLKIDCEGAEYDIILNAPRSIFKKIDNIVLEYHTPFGDPKKLKNLLEDCGFKVIEETKGVYFASKTP